MKLNLGAFADCVGKISVRSGLTPQQSEVVIQRLADRAEKMRNKGVEDPFNAAAQEQAEKAAQKARAAKIDVIRNLEKRKAILDPILAGKITDAAPTLRGKLYWQPGADPKANIQSFWRGLNSKMMSLMWATLQKEGLIKAATNDEFFPHIAEEYWKISSDEPSSKPSNDPARRIAEIFAPIANHMKDRLNAEGAVIADAKDFAGHTVHDAFLLRRGGRGAGKTPTVDEAFARWRDAILPRLNHDKTFDELELRPGETEAQARDRFLRGTFEALVTGIRKTAPGKTMGDYVPLQFEGPSNIARKVSEGRVLFFKDAASWSDYMKLYGKPQNFFSLMTDTVGMGARRVALMHFLGTNPEANFDRILDKIGEHFRSDVDGVNKFQQDVNGGLLQPNLHNVMSHLDGSANLPVNQLYSTIGKTIRAFYRMVYLGGVGLTHAASVVGTFPSEARHHGIGIFSAFGALGKALIPNAMKSEERLAAASDWAAYADGASRAAFNAFDHGWNLPGVVAQADHWFHAATGINYLFSHVRDGMKEMLSHNMGRQMDKEYGALEPHLRQLLNAYGVDEPAWDLLRNTDPLKVDDGKVYLTPRHAMEMNAGGVEALLRSQGKIAANATPETVDTAVAAYRQNVADGMMMYLEDASDHAVVKGGAREQAMLKGGIRPGTWQDEVLSSVMMFKTWPIAMLHQAVGREIYQSLSKKDAVYGMGMIIALSTLGGYLRMTARDAFYGTEFRKPKDLTEASKIGLAALAQGGGLGIFGDMLFGEVNRFGASNMSSFGGPVATDMSQLFHIYNEWASHLGTPTEKDVWPELTRFAINHVPGGNLFYLKGSLDYMAWYHIFEAMHPGWWARTNARMEKDQGRSMQGYSPGGTVPYGIPGVYLNDRGRTTGLFGAH